MRIAISTFITRGTAATLFCLLSGCAEDESPPRARVQTPLTVPVPTLNQFAVIASRSITIADRGQVNGGDVGVAASPNATPNVLTSGFDSRVGVGEVVLAQRVVLRDRTVAGEIGANVIEAPAATTGPRSAFVAPPAQPVPGTFVSGTTAVNVNPGQTSTLAPGRFGAINVSGTLNLTGGLYELASLRLNPDARVTVLGSSTLRVTGGVALADRSRLLPGPANGPGGVRLLVSGNIEPNTSVTVGTDAQLGALVVARNVFRSADRAIATGAIAALDVFLGVDARVNFNTGIACGSNAQCDDGNACTTDTCVDTQCVRTSAPNGTTCSDGNACTRTDSCVAGACVGTNPLVCTASDQCHDPGVCSPATGLCSNPAKPNGVACNDGSVCTRADSCQAGVCAGADPVICTALDACHAPGTCDPGTGVCSNPVRADGSACDDGNLCTQTDACVAGGCVGGNGVVCTAIDACHVPGVCDPSSGTCSSPPAPDGTACSDGNACTQADACAMGSCLGANPVVCVAADECHDAGVCDPASGACSEPPAPDGTTCDDGNACTHGDECRAGACGPSGELAVTEFPTGLHQPGYIVSGPLGSLWFLSAESSFGAIDSAIAQITTSGTITATQAFRNMYSLLHGPDGMLWVGDTVPGGLPTLGRFSATTRTFVTDFLGIQPHDLVGTNDGNVPIVWFTGGSSVGRVTPAGAVLASVPTFNATRAITAAPPAPTSTIWFTEANNAGRAFIGRLQFPNLVQFPIETPGELADIVVGPDGGVWFTDVGRNEITRLAPTGAGLVRHPLPAGSGPYAITTGPDGNLWATLRSANKVVRLTTAGEMTEICVPTASSDPTHLVAGPDGNIWFTQRASGKVARIQLGP